MRHACFLIATLLSMRPVFAEDPRTWGQRLADSTIAEHPSAWSLRKSDGEYRWAYTLGLVTYSMYKLHLKYHEPAYYAYMKAYVDHYVEADGSIRTLALDELSLDSINSGKLLFPLLQDTGDARYRAAIEVLHRQLQWQPRTRNGVFWHKRKYPWQVWLDGLYMAAPFYAEYAARFNHGEYFDDIARQFRESYAKLRDPDTGLLYHAWDESRIQRWSDPGTGRSPGFWTRSLGWYSMALVDTYEHFPAEHEGRSDLARMLAELSEALLAVRDARSKLWWQVPDQGGREGNYLEASGSAMIAYAWAKGARLGMLEPRFRELARQSFDGLVETLVDWDAKTGRMQLRNVCRSAGLGGEPYRDGTYEYYVSTDVVVNDAHGVGAFLLASAEIETPATPDAPPDAAPLSGEEILLWPGDAPGSEGLTLEEVLTERSRDPNRHDRFFTGVLRPSLSVHRPAVASGAAVIVAPGGGYQRIVIDKEGRDVAEWLNGLGVTAFVLKYRLPGEGHVAPADVPLQDAQRAMRVLRSRAESLGIDPRRIGILGFSAGGHLAGSLAAYHDASVYAPVDGADRQSARPDFAVLVYPAVGADFVQPDVLERYPGLRRVVSKYPLEPGVSKDWPPTFLLQAADDPSVVDEGSLRLFHALRSAGVPAEIHVFQHGGHGFGIRNAEGPVARWPTLCGEWLRSLGVLD